MPSATLARERELEEDAEAAVLLRNAARGVLGVPEGCSMTKRDEVQNAHSGEVLTPDELARLDGQRRWLARCLPSQFTGSSPPVVD